ncbi:MAG: DUF5004 domain-containing protein [Sphingobacteriaceae bacterium]|nr:MAG: DUF5004 domain-containing protein [Sphingobacteriaceae bacterium]
MKTRNNLIAFSTLLFAMVLMLATSCKVEEKASFKNENAKNISGTWKILTATRNGTDLATLVPAEINDFRIKFNEDKSFTLANPIPFLAVSNGTYTFDDPVTPFSITMTDGDGNASTTSFNYPITSGKRQIKLTFSPGCGLNSYIYTLEKTND